MSGVGTLIYKNGGGVGSLSNLFTRSLRCEVEIPYKRRRPSSYDCFLSDSYGVRKTTVMREEWEEQTDWDRPESVAVPIGLLNEKPVYLSLVREANETGINSFLKLTIEQDPTGDSFTSVLALEPAIYYREEEGEEGEEIKKEIACILPIQ